MLRSSRSILVVAFGLVLSFVAATWAEGGEMLNPLGPVTTGKSATEREPITQLGRKRSYYLAGSEELGAQEMRIISLGSGMPQVQKAQASACWLVELGNGDSFIFDIGSGCTANMSMLEMPWDRFTKVFITHLHSDHFGDLPTLLAGGWQMGRSIPLKVWGPSGAEPELGIRAAVANLLEMFRWEFLSKRGRAPMSSYAIEVHEFDYAKEQVVYQENGVTIRSWPAVHVMDGPVSYSLEWNGLKFSYSGDTTANEWFLKNARDSDFVVHECSDPVEVLIESRKHLPESAWLIATTAHTQPQLAGYLFSELQPRMAVCFHYVDDGIAARQKLYESVRNVYSGPLSIAQDMMVWNVTADSVVVREVVGGTYSFSLPRGDEPPDQSKLIEPSAWLEEGRVDSSAVYKQVLEKLDPEYRKRILEFVPHEKLPPME